MTKFLSARRLGITTAEHAALVRTAEIIGASPFVPDRRIRYAKEPGEPTRGLGFNLGFIAEAYDCGTSCCVGGHVSLLMQGVDLTAEHPVVTPDQRLQADKYVHKSDPDRVGGGGDALTPLYYPTLWVLDDARPGDAVHAIRNFLTTGRPQWEAVIRARQRTERELSHA